MACAADENGKGGWWWVAGVWCRWLFAVFLDQDCLGAARVGEQKKLSGSSQQEHGCTV